MQVLICMHCYQWGILKIKLCFNLQPHILNISINQAEFSVSYENTKWKWFWTATLPDLVALMQIDEEGFQILCVDMNILRNSSILQKWWCLFHYWNNSLFSITDIFQILNSDFHVICNHPLIALTQYSLLTAISILQIQMYNE